MTNITKSIITLLIISLILPSFSFAQEDQLFEKPGGLEQFKKFGKKILEIFPKALKGAWQEALEIWRKMADWIKNFWNSYIFSWLQNIWRKISDFFRKEIGEKKLITEIKEEFKAEEEKKETPEEEKNLWEKFWERLKRLIKK